MADIGKIVKAIREDIVEKINCMKKRLKDGLADIVCSILIEPTSNTHVLSETSPRSIGK